MSASKDKILRREQRAAGIDKKAEAAAKEAAARRKTNRTYIIAAVVLVVALLFIWLVNSDLPTRLTAVTIDDESYSVAELNYYYSNTYQNFYNTYGEFIQYGMMFDPSISISDQMYTEDQTWREYFLEMSIGDMKQIQVLCDQAEAAGFTALPEDYQAQYDEAVASLETGWQLNGYSSLEQFIAMIYGKGVDFEMVKDLMYRAMLASAYADQVYEGYEYSAQELDAYYAENADDLDSFRYSYYFFTPEEGESPTAQEKAEALYEAVKDSDVESFGLYLAENFDGAEVYSSTVQGSNLSAVYSDWLKDEARVAGECTLEQTESGSWYVVMFEAREKNDYYPRSFRHILINAQDTDGDGVFSQEEVQAAQTRAEELLAEWEAGAADENSFATLATLNSDDTASVSVGGLYENSAKGQMVPPVNDWLFDEARQVGDAGVVVYNEGGNYTGAHVLYYAGEAELSYAASMADSSLRTEQFNDWSGALEEALTVSTSNLGMAAKHY